ncbi:P60-like protein [Leucogyrophana mollusca]|uniref:P60-like protein n=1 Tax=Leucogyrophana mollusca TaxID=85980 RepID=A0ACB8BWJ3_9AGAM|nr:P60-like protein [Leucogyrophana mollusca]
MAAPSASTKKSARSAVGAPSQHTQSSRKGKRAWRKNIDIDPVEEGLEGLRAEERVTGSILQKQTDEQLFQIDVRGDDKIRKSLPRYSKAELTATKILAQRSAIPAVFSRPSASVKRNHKAGVKISPADKQRLLRMARRPQKGPLNAIMDPTEFGAGSAIIDVSNAVKNSGGYDAWVPVEEEDVRDGLETVKRAKIKKPDLGHPRDAIELPAIAEPHQGASYNPPASAHEALILKAYAVEHRRAQEADRLAAIRQRIASARRPAEEGDVVGVPAGMVVDEVGGDEDVDDAAAEVVIPTKLPARKTKQQHARAAKLRAEKQALAEKASKKRLLASIPAAKSLRSAAGKIQQAHEQARLARRLALRAKLRDGLAGQRLGKHKVPEIDVDVQIGEELSENLRSLKPEGNLFRDRFRSLQQRALIEPRVPVLPTRRKYRIKEYEKHAWKRFE